MSILSICVKQASKVKFSFFMIRHFPFQSKLYLAKLENKEKAVIHARYVSGKIRHARYE